MAEIELPIIKLEENRFQADIDLNIYAKETIVVAAYKFSNIYYIYQQTDKNNKHIINVIFESKGKNIVSVNDVKQFFNELLDQQIRYNTNLQFGEIRNKIVEEAFKPVNK